MGSAPPRAKARDYSLPSQLARTPPVFQQRLIGGVVIALQAERRGIVRRRLPGRVGRQQFAGGRRGHQAESRESSDDESTVHRKGADERAGLPRLWGIDSL